MKLYELDLKWDFFIGYSRHFNSRCAYRKSVVGWEHFLKAVVMNEVYVKLHWPQMRSFHWLLSAF